MEKKKLLGIIAAMDSEIKALKGVILAEETEVISGIEFIRGKIKNTEVVIAKCGVGKVFAAVCTQTMIMRFKPDVIINIGVCGTLTDKLDLCDIVIGEKTVQYDMDTSAVGDPVGLISGINKIYFECDDALCDKLSGILKKENINHIKGVIATGDRFFNDASLVKMVSENFGAVSGDMESGSIGHVCYINNVPYGILRCITDKGDENSGADYINSIDKATHVIFEVVMKLCEEGI